MVCAIFALDASDGFGFQNKLPWKNTKDMKRFVSLTRGGVVIMGRHTWDSLTKPLKARVNIIVTSQDVFYQDKDVYVCKSLREALLLGKSNFPDKIIWLIGGTRIFREAFENRMISRIYLTRFHSTYRTDITFSIQEYLKDFRLAHREEEDVLSFETYILWY